MYERKRGAEAKGGVKLVVGAEAKLSGEFFPYRLPFPPSFFSLSHLLSPCIDSHVDYMRWKTVLNVSKLEHKAWD